MGYTIFIYPAQQCFVLLIVVQLAVCYHLLTNVNANIYHCGDRKACRLCHAFETHIYYQLYLRGFLWR